MAIKDSEFVRGKVPLTKQEIRAVSLAKLNLQSTDHLLDIGAGTGGITIEAAVAHPNMRITAVDCNASAIELIHQNAKKFDTNNIHTLQGYAPEVLAQIDPPTKIFIGGSKGNLAPIFEWILQNTPSGTTVVANAITLETFEQLRTCVQQFHLIDTEIVQLSTSHVQALGSYTMFKAQNPIFIFTTTTP